MTGYNDSCWQDLANEIVLSAVEDWRRSKLQLSFPSLASRHADGVVKSCERFFLSTYFQVLTDLDGKCFLKRLKEGFSFQ